jgi:hypothetical protein
MGLKPDAPICLIKGKCVSSYKVVVLPFPNLLQVVFLFALMLCHKCMLRVLGQILYLRKYRWILVAHRKCVKNCQAFISRVNFWFTLISNRL